MVFTIQKMFSGLCMSEHTGGVCHTLFEIPLVTLSPKGEAADGLVVPQVPPRWRRYLL